MLRNPTQFSLLDLGCSICQSRPPTAGGLVPWILCWTQPGWSPGTNLPWKEGALQNSSLSTPCAKHLVCPCLLQLSCCRCISKGRTNHDTPPTTGRAQKAACESQCPAEERRGEHCETGLEQPGGFAGDSRPPQISEFPSLLGFKGSWEQGCCSSQEHDSACIQAPNAPVFCSFMTGHKLLFLSRAV